MDRETAIARLTGAADELRRQGVASLYLFGSTARGDARHDSDVDLFLEYADPRFRLVELVRVKRLLDDALGARAHVATRDGLHPLLRDRIVASAVRVL
jgi:hypothetical protein